MRAQAQELSHRASEAGLSPVAYVLEVAALLLEEAEAASGKRPDAHKA